MEDPPGRTVLVVNGRVQVIPAIHSADRVRLRSSPAWWGSLALVGASLIALGALVGAGVGPYAATAGAALFVVTAVLAGAERYEFTTAFGVAAVIWTSTGIAVDLGTDRSLFASFLGFAIAGLVILVAGSWGIARSRSRNPSRTDSGG